jgi:enamine deaminase RidA (YjgF/YER057c/UK114 family)
MNKVFVPVSPPTGWKSRYTYSAAVRAGDLLFISGMTAADESGRLIGEGDIVRQSEYIYEKMHALLQQSGADFGNVVETTDYFLTLTDYHKTAEVRRRVFGGPPFPAATGVQVAGLIRPGALIEIKAVAVLREQA